MENYNGWLIDYETKESGGFFSKDIVVEATIIPDVLNIYNSLKKDEKVTCSIDTIHQVYNELGKRWPYGETLTGMINGIIARQYARNTSGIGIYGYSREIQHDVNVFEKLVNFGNTNTHHTTQSSTSRIADWIDGDRTERRTLEKVKKWISESLPNPKQSAIDYLRNNYAI